MDSFFVLSGLLTAYLFFKRNGDKEETHSQKIKTVSNGCTVGCSCVEWLQRRAAQWAAVAWNGCKEALHSGLKLRRVDVMTCYTVRFRKT